MDERVEGVCGADGSEEFAVPAGTVIHIAGLPFVLAQPTLLRGLRANLKLTGVAEAPLETAPSVELSPQGRAEDPYPYGKGQAAENRWAASHEPAMSFGVWLDPELKGCVRLHIARDMPLEVMAAALGLIHMNVDRVGRLLMALDGAEGEGSGDPVHSC